MKEKHSINAIVDPQLRADEIANRKKLIDWICDIGDRLKVAAETIHRAATYIDRIISQNNLKEEELKSIGLICILLAGKLTESDNEVSQIASLFRKNIGNPRINIRMYEIQIMNHLNWDLQRITAIDFINFFLSQGIVFTSDYIHHSNVNEQSASFLRQYVEFFSDLCLQEYEFISIDSLILAGGIIAAGRKVLKFEKVWREELEALTSVKHEQAEECAALILFKYEKLFPKSYMKENVNPNLG